MANNQHIPPAVQDPRYERGGTIMTLPARVVPAINLTIDSNTHVNSVEHMMQAVDRVLNPERYCPPPGYDQPTHDDYGTPLAMLTMPSVWDKQENMKMHRGNVVSPMSMLMMRMQWGPFDRNDEDGMLRDPVPFEHMAVHLGNGKAFVFIVTNGEPVTLTDEPGIFPSDALITQVRMLAERAKKT